jgi:exodeoxyribonuclease VII large subunit
MEIQKRWGVSELTRYIRQMFEMDYRLADVEVEGEVSNWRAPASGHVYFTLKDADSQIKAVMWRSDVLAQRGLPQDGERVVARGNISVYEAQGQYQLICRRLLPVGAGDLAAQFEALRDRLGQEGLFDPARKRPLPDSIHVIGVVTSASTAAFQDVLNILRRRNPLAQVILSPTPVQGSDAPPQIVAALEALNHRPEVDVILLVRGGGSLEDLWCFNDERVARALAASRLPVISGIGHEIDFTLADFAADVRAPTPSAAAELASPLTRDDLIEHLNSLTGRLNTAQELAFTAGRDTVERLTESLRYLSPRSRIENSRQRLDDLLARSERAVRAGTLVQRGRLQSITRMLAAMNPQATLARGYAVVRGAQGQIVRRAADAPPGAQVRIQLEAGNLTASVTESTEP